MYMAPELFNGNVYNEKVVSQSGAILSFKLPHHLCDKLLPSPLLLSPHGLLKPSSWHSWTSSALPPSMAFELFSVAG